jgi:serine protease inhibitor
MIYTWLAKLLTTYSWKRIGVVVVSYCVLAEPMASTENRYNSSDGYRSLALDALAQLASESRGDVVVSPSGLTDALGLLELASQGETKREISTFLSSGRASQSTKPDPCVDPRKATSPEASQTTVWQCALALFHRSEIVIKPTFKTSARRTFNLVFGDLDNAESLRSVNSWVAKQTRGHIQSLVDESSDSVQVLIVSTNYFSGKWQSPFDPYKTSRAPFQTQAGSVLDVDMMTLSAELRYYENLQYQAVELPYDASYSGIIILPKGELNGAFRGADEILKRLMKVRTKAQGAVRVPKFSISNGFSLKPFLLRSGVKAAFSPLQSDFGAISENSRGLYVNDVRQRAVLKVNEYGTEATSATAIEIFGSVPAKANQFTFVANRPFIFLVVETGTKSVLYASAVREPRP